MNKFLVNKIGLFYGFIGVAIFSLTLPMTKIAVVGIDPITIAVWRGILAAGLAFIIIMTRRPTIPGKENWRGLFLCAFGTVFGFPIFTTLAMQTVSASHGAVVIGLLPLTTAIIGVLISDERPSFSFWIVSVIGTGLTLTFVLRQAEGSIVLGDIYLVLAVLLAALGYAYGGRVAKQIGGWQVVCWSLLISTPFLSFALFFIEPLPLSNNVRSLLAFLYLAIFSQVLGFFALYKGMAIAGIARVSQVQLLQLFLTVAAATFLLDEALDNEVLLFGSLVIITVWIGTRLNIKKK